MIETTWQDFAITGITVLFAVMLLPQLRDVMTRGAVLNVFTALATSLLGYLLALVFTTLGLWLSAFGQGLGATVWMLLACFSLRNVRDHAFPDETLASVAWSSLRSGSRGGWPSPLRGGREGVLLAEQPGGLTGPASPGSPGAVFHRTGGGVRQQGINPLSGMMSRYGLQRLRAAALRDEAV